MAAMEKDHRLSILNTLLTTPHRELSLIWPVHAAMVQQDPRFYVRLAAWYADHGEVRDHHEMFIITLVLSDFAGHRDVGLALLRRLPPYQVGRVVDFINGKVQPAQTMAQPSDPTEQAHRPSRRDRSAQANAPEPGGASLARQGLFKNLPRSLKTEITRYLREREADPAWFDSTVLGARKALKRLYALLHIKPSERAQRILFDDQPPPDSKLYALKELAKTTDPAEQARLIVEQAIPFRVAATLADTKSEAVLLALVQVMSPQELINSLAMLKRRGAFEQAAVKAAIEAKLHQAKTSKRISAMKVAQAIQAAGLSGAVSEQLQAVADAQVQAKGQIHRDILMLIDKSGSMSVAIELGKRIGAMLSAVTTKQLYVYACDSIAYPIESSGQTLADWEKAMAGITADGATSLGVGLEMLRRKRIAVEQIIVVTDEGENTAPTFVPVYQRYARELGVEPNVCFVKTPGASMQMELECKAAGIIYDAFDFRGDYYALPNLIPLLARPSKMDLLLEIMDYPLPSRQPA